MTGKIKFFLMNFDGFLACLLVSILTILLFEEVIARYFFHTSSAGVSEFCGVCFVWFVYLSISYITGKRNHIVVDVANLIFPKSFLKYIDLFSDLAFLFFSAVMTWYGGELVYSTVEYSFTLSISGLSMGVAYFILPFAFGIMSIRLFVLILEDLSVIFKSWQTEKNDG